MVRERKDRLESSVERSGSSSAVVDDADDEVESSDSKDQGFLEWGQVNKWCVRE